jgi:hypothetical protein
MRIYHFSMQNPFQPKKVRDGMSSPGPFVHEPLDPTRASIRLVQIQPGKPGDIIQCKLKYVPLERSHTCLSYICGTSEERKEILVNDHRYRVLPNLWSFLNLARKLNITDWLWIDAISINQTDIYERNETVKQMSDIYRQAQHVFLWPGHWPRGSPTAREGWMRVLFHNNDPVRSVLLNKYWAKIYRALGELEYFRRVWIIQELILARKCSIILGTNILPWKPVSRFVRTFSNELSEKDKAYEGSPAVRLAQQTDDRGGRALSNEFNMLLKESARGKCSEPRDHLYAILGLVDDKRKFAIDYGEDPSHILIHALQYFISVPEVEGGFGLNHHIFNRLGYLNTSFSVHCGCACEKCSSILHGEQPPNGHGDDRGHEETAMMFSIASQELLRARTKLHFWRKSFIKVVEDDARIDWRQCGICEESLLPKYSRSNSVVRGKIYRVSLDLLLVVIING